MCRLNIFSVTGLDEEGLFRLTAGSSKVRRLRAEIEAGQVSPPQLHNVYFILQLKMHEFYASCLDSSMILNYKYS